jgi:drug/metabolite transporter (DMT)-like permease
MLCVFLSGPSMALSPLAIQRGLFLFLCLVWGTNWLAMKAGTAEVPPGIFSGLRWTMAGAVLLGFLALRGDPVRVPGRLWGRIVWVSVLMIPANAVVMLYGLRHVPSGLAAVLNAALTPIAMVGFAAMLGQERFSRRHLGALAVGVVGVLVLYGPKAAVGSLQTLEILGAAGVVLGNLAYCYSSVSARPLMGSLPPVHLVAVTNFIGGAVLLVLALAFEPGALAAARLDWSPVAWASWWYLLLPASLGATIIYFRLMRDWGPGRVGSYAFISPVVAVLLGIAAAGERVGGVEALGMALMLAAAFLALRK